MYDEARLNGYLFVFSFDGVLMPVGENYDYHDPRFIIALEFANRMVKPSSELFSLIVHSEMEKENRYIQNILSQFENDKVAYGHLTRAIDRWQQKYRLLTPDSNQERITKKPERKAGYVYLVKSEKDYYKIGYTSNPKNRARTFGIQLPFEIEFVCLIQTDDMKNLEASLHKQFDSKRVNGEWFALSPEDVEYIKGLAE